MAVASPTTVDPANSSPSRVNYRAVDDQYLARQLPYLQEKAPAVVTNELLEIPSNAPPTLPSPPLFPGEVLRMKQHRVVCLDVHSEPLVGVVYLTNFRIIFNGTPIMAPDACELVKDMQFLSVSRTKESLSLSDSNSVSGTLSAKQLASNPSVRRKKKFDPRASKFYIGENEDLDEGNGDMEVGGARNGDRLHTKVMKKISTLRRNSEKPSAGTSAEQTKHLPNPARKHNPIAISLPLSNPSNNQTTDSNSCLSTSAPNVPENSPMLLSPYHKPTTLPRPVPSSKNTPTTQPKLPQASVSCNTNDSGFVDPPLSKPASVEKELDNDDMVSGDIDFEKPIEGFEDDEPVIRRSSEKRAHYFRPESIIAVESDSDSDSASDKYFGNIVEDEEDDEERVDSRVTSPEYVSSPPVPTYKESSDSVDSIEPHPLSPISLKSTESHPLRDSYVTSTDRTANSSSVSSLITSDEPLPQHLIAGETGDVTPDVVAKRPSKPPRRKNKFQQKNSNDSDKVSNGEITSSMDSTAASSTTNEERSPIHSPDLVENESGQKPKVPTRTNKQSIRRAPPPPPLTTQGESAITMETRSQPIADQGTIKPPLSLDLQTEEDDSRVSQSSMYANCPSSAGSLMKRFTFSSPIDQGYSSSSWGTTADYDRKSHFNTWSDPRLNTKMIPYIQYTHSASVPISSLHMVKSLPSVFLEMVGLKLSDGVLVVSRTFSFLKLYFHPSNTFDSAKFKELLENIVVIQKPIYSLFAFKYRSAIKLPNPHFFDSRKISNFFSFDSEVVRLGILDVKLENSHIWRVTTVSKEHPELCRSYPEKLIVLLCTPDVDLLRGASLYEEGRFPTACWMNPGNQSVLLRAAATKQERGQQGAKLSVDEAILHAIRKCNKHDKLFVFTEKSEAIGFQDPTKLNPDAARSYYYHNCHFSYTINPPTFKSVRHSFSKLQAMMLNNISDEEYFSILDGTKWLCRISELLETACKVCHALAEESAHVLVCYENGRDRTTQITSLSQLLSDPYYRTMNGFQVLIQKEWLWFGHPFNARHGYQKSKVKKEGPVFLQWLDCVYQVMRQFPLAFEFNESLLLALVDQSYSDQFGTFLMNSERERHQCFMVPEHYHQSVNMNTISIWSWISMMNASNRIFYNPLYCKEFHTRVLYPKYYQTCLEVWRNCYDREKVHTESDYSLQKTEFNQLLALYNERLNITKADSVLSERHSPTHNGSFALKIDDLATRTSPLPSPLYGITHSRTKSEKTYSDITDYLCKEGYDPSICHHIKIKGKTCEGYLVKEGGVMKNWKKRWFILDFQNEYFTYFESMEHFLRNENPKGVISLNQIKKVSLSTKREHLLSNLFQVRTPTRLYNIKAPSIISMEIWMACLRLSPSALK